MIKMMLFDVDGVLLSEERYFDASALTVWELLFSPHYLGLSGEEFNPAPSEEDIRRLRSMIFADDQVLDFMKNRGINANWDMVYLSFAHQLIRLMEILVDDRRTDIEQWFSQEITRESLQRLASWLKVKDFEVDYGSFIEDVKSSRAEKQELLLYMNDLTEQKLGVKTEVFGRNSQLWELCQETFQEWYLGDDLVPEDIGRPTFQPGKKGFLQDEIPIVDPKEMAQVFATLREKGIILGIGTGRPSIETLVPLKAMGLLDYFDPNRIITATDVLQAENEHPSAAPLAKPQPFCYIKGWLGRNVENQACLDFALPLMDGNQLLIVGDSVADHMAAKSMGCRFAATLTGLTGVQARPKFEELEADYILNDMREVTSIV
ncbi:HAD family hydrolase [Ammoniphilus sp. CFH 90114]|uniref:HAD family hydrolase n=1 Tax=Ammoniphilus sp. CFH 90114 TaxID=2493665 RepID=UPI00100FD8F7|nr:HAD family hydrolase [Ammoniphilus sp. CFH 90114]RXT13859.1 HAD family hydrolase [Ammoniphilus sp. CFH 90114]